MAPYAAVLTAVLLVATGYFALQYWKDKRDDR